MVWRGHLVTDVATYIVQVLQSIWNLLFKFLDDLVQPHSHDGCTELHHQLGLLRTKICLVIRTNLGWFITNKNMSGHIWFFMDVHLTSSKKSQTALSSAQVSPFRQFDLDGMVFHHRKREGVHHRKWLLDTTQQGNSLDEWRILGNQTGECH